MIINGVRRGAARRASSSSSGSDQSVSPRHDTDEDTEEAEGIASENVQPLVDERRQEGHSSLLLKDANSWMQTAAAKKLLERSKEGKRATYSHVARLDDQNSSEEEGEEEGEGKSHEPVNVRVTVHSLKHLPRMDKFGKVDAYCIVTLDNREHGGQTYRRKTKVIKKNYNPQFLDEQYDFEVKDYTNQELVVSVWDWDAGSEDDLIGSVSVKLSALASRKKIEEVLYPIKNEAGDDVIGFDGCPSMLNLSLERDVIIQTNKGKRKGLVLGEKRILDCSNKQWESSVRGLMFEVENRSEYPAMITGLHISGGRSKSGSCSYTIYRAPGRWNVGRCPCNRLLPCRFCFLCCGSFPSGRPNVQMMKCFCRCRPCTSRTSGCCCCGECGPGLEVAEPCCDGCVSCCTGNCACPLVLFPYLVPLCCWGCGCLVGERHGGVSEPGMPAISLCRCCGCKCCRNGVHRHAKDCNMLEFPGWRCDANCSCCSSCCSCCRRKYYDRRRWTRVTSAWKDMPSDWGQVGQAISFTDFEGGGILLPPRQFVSLYIHSPHPVDVAGQGALAVRGPFVHEHDSGDVTERDEVLLVRTGAATMGVLPFANSEPRRSDMDGQVYRLREQHLDPHRVFGFAGKIEYHLLPKGRVPADCVTLCGRCPWCC